MQANKTLNSPYKVNTKENGQGVDGRGVSNKM